MALHMRRTLLSLHRTKCSSFKPPEVLDVRSPGPLLLTVRTKKRYFIPPAVGLKKNGAEDAEAKARAAGIVFRQEYFERPINIACTAGIFDPYIPPEGDARLSSLSKEGLKQRTEQIRQSAASQLAIRKIKEHDPEFSSKTFAEKAQEIFIEAHYALSNFNKERLHFLVSERCYPEMTRGNRYKTIRWKFIESLEPPRVVHARCPDMVSKGNLYGQVTVRMHSKQVSRRFVLHLKSFHFLEKVLQMENETAENLLTEVQYRGWTLAVYDRFGRRMLGDEEQPRDVLEYLVMERHIMNPYGTWRLHGKIVPSWAPAKDPVIKTVRIPGPELKPWEEFDSKNYQVPKPEAVQWSK